MLNSKNERDDLKTSKTKGLIRPNTRNNNKKKSFVIFLNSPEIDASGNLISTATQ